MFDWKRKMALLVVPAALMVGAVSVTAHAAAPPTVTAQATSQPAEAPGQTEQPEATTADANEPSLPGGGHSDAAGQADHQFDGTE